MVIGDALMLSPEDTLAIGLLVLAVVQAAKLLHMPPEWSPVVAVFLGGAIGVAAGLSNGLPAETWLSMFYGGATGGLTGAGVYSVGRGMGELSGTLKRKAAAKARAEKGPTDSRAPPAPKPVKAGAK